MQAPLIAYAATAPVFFAMDFVWLGVTAERVYKANLGGMMMDKPNLGVAAGFYLIYVIGVVVFAVMPAIEQASWMRALWGGALLGLVAYGAYDLTNLATLKNWPWVVSAVDMAWGTFATGIAATAGYFITRYFTA